MIKTWLTSNKQMSAIIHLKYQLKMKLKLSSLIWNQFEKKKHNT